MTKNGTKAVEADFFTQILCPGNLRANKTGDLLFATKRANPEKNRYDTAHWLWQKGRLRHLRLPAGTAGHWWRDGGTLLLATPGGPAEKRRAKKGLPTTIFKTMGTRAGDKAEALFSLFAEAEWAWPLPGGHVLVLAQWDPAVENALAQAEGDPDKAAALLEKQAGHTVWEELPFWENGGGVVAGKRRRLYLWEGGEPRPLTGTDLEVEEAALSPDGSTVYLAAKTWEKGVATITHTLYALDLASGKMQDRTFAALRLDALLSMENGSLVVAGSDMKAHGLNQDPAFYRLDGDGAVTLLDGSGAYSPWSSVGSDVNMPGPARWYARGQSAYFLSTLGDSSHLMRLNAETGAIAPVTRQPGAVGAAAPAGDGWFAVALRAQNAPEMYHIAEDGTETPLTRFNDLAGFRLAEMRPLAAQTAEGPVHGWVMLPPGEEGRKAKKPGLLYIHGGPKTVYGPVLFHEMQYWAAQGYAVMLCNPPGSDGLGDDFADIRGDYGGRDSRQLLAFLDAALREYPAIDAERVGVAGGSYGGFMVNWLIGHTTCFAAAVSQRSIANWVSMALLSDIGYYFVPDQAGAGSWQAAMDGTHAPLSAAQNARTPTLFLHSDEDYRCPLPEGIQMYTALKLAGVSTRMAVFHGENHELSRSGKPQNRLARLAEMRRWLAQYLNASP